MNKFLFISSVLSLNAFAQPTFIDQWQKNLTLYYKNHTPVKLHLFFNQPAYAPGDTAYFRAAFITASENIPIKGNQIIKIDVIDKNGIVKLQQEFRMDDGWSGNQLVIPPDFHSGIYRVIAFNDWMKNFDPTSYFQAQLEIVGSFNYELVPKKQTLGCFPEGGKLIEGLSSKVVVLTSHAEWVTVTDSHGTKVAETSTDQAGFGFFFLTPAENETYNVATATKTIKIHAEKEGVSVMFTPTLKHQAQHRLIMQASKNSEVRHQYLILVISKHDQIFYSATFRFDNKQFVALSIDPSLLPDGLCYLTVNTRSGDILATRLFFNVEKVQLKPQITLSKKTFSTREAIQVDFTLKDNNNNPILARISTSVFRSDLHKNPQTINSIVSYMTIYSDIHSDDQDLPFNRIDSADFLDLLLITRDWRWYSWKELLNSVKGLVYNLRDYQTVSGKLTDLSTGKPIAETTRITFYFSGAGEIYSTSTDSTGVFEAKLLFDFYDDEPVYYWIEKDNHKLEGAKIELTQIRPLYTKIETTFNHLDSNTYYSYSNEIRRLSSSYKFYKNQQSLSLQEAPNQNTKMEKFLNGVDHEIDLDDYMLFPTMQETLTEVIPFLRNTKIQSKDAVWLYRPDNNAAPTLPPMFMIDGVITDDYNYFLSLNPVNVDKVKLIQSSNKLKKLGVLGRNGFVLVETKIANNQSNVLQNSTYLMIRGLARELDFREKLPAWQFNNPRSPRLKSALFWRANEKLDNQGKITFAFNTSDDTGRYIIRIEGLTSTGKPFIVTEEFCVQPY